MSRGSDESTYRLILVGKTGNGKSATGNWILGNIHFGSEESANSVTQGITVGRSTGLKGKNIIVIDTPGLFDTKKPLIQTALQIQESLKDVPPGPHAFLIVLKPVRFTEEEERTLETLMIMFGPKFVDHSIIIFSHIDHVKNIDKFLKESESNERIKSLFDKCGRRIFKINNEETNSEIRQQNRKSFMLMVRELSDNGKLCYQEDISIYRHSLEQHANEWTDTHLNISQIQTIMQEQHEEALRVERERQDRLRKEENERREMIERHERNINQTIEQVNSEIKKANECTYKIVNEQLEKLIEVLQKEMEIINKKLEEMNKSCKSATESNIHTLNQKRKNEIQRLKKYNETSCDTMHKEQMEEIDAIKEKMKRKIKKTEQQWKNDGASHEMTRKDEVDEMEIKRKKEIEDLANKCKSLHTKINRDKEEYMERVKNQYSIHSLRKLRKAITENQIQNLTETIEKLETDCINESMKVTEGCDAKLDGLDIELKEDIMKLEASWKTESENLQRRWIKDEVTEKGTCRDALDKLFRNWTDKVDITKKAWDASRERVNSEREEHEKRLVQQIDGHELIMKEAIKRIENEVTKDSKCNDRNVNEEIEKLNKIYQNETERITKKREEVNQSIKIVTEISIKRLNQTSSDDLERLKEATETSNDTIRKEQLEKIKKIKRKMQKHIDTTENQWKDDERSQDMQRNDEVHKVENQMRQEIKELEDRYKSLNAKQAKEIEELFHDLKGQCSVEKLRQMWETRAKDPSQNWTETIEKLKSVCSNESKRVKEACDTKLKVNVKTMKDAIKKLEDSWKTKSDNIEKELIKADQTWKETSRDQSDRLIQDWTNKVHKTQKLWKEEKERAMKEEKDRLTEEVRKKKLKARKEKRKRKEMEKPGVIKSALIAGATLIGTDTGQAVAQLLGVPETESDSDSSSD